MTRQRSAPVHGASAEAVLPQLVGSGAAPRGAAGERIEGLDAWRAGMLVLGILLHAALMSDEQHWAFFLVVRVSSMFRMAAFFAIAGYLAALTIARTDPATWFRRRIEQVGVPMATCLLVLEPMRALIIGVPPLSTLGHGWFLVALFVYVWLTTLLREHESFVRQRLQGWSSVLPALDGQGGMLALAAIGSAVLALGVMTATWLGARTELLSFEAVPIIRGILMHAPFYFAGYALCRSALLRGVLLSRAAIPTCVCAAMLLWNVLHFALAGLPKPDLGPDDGGGMSMRLVLIISNAICAVGAICLVLRSAFRIEHTSDLVRRVSQASLTIYLVHYLLVHALWEAALAFTRNDFMLFTISSTGAFAIGYGFHHGVVARVPILQFLFNGRYGGATRAPSRSSGPIGNGQRP